MFCRNWHFHIQYIVEKNIYYFDNIITWSPRRFTIVSFVRVLLLTSGTIAETTFAIACSLVFLITCFVCGTGTGIGTGGTTFLGLPLDNITGTGTVAFLGLPVVWLVTGFILAASSANIVLFLVAY